MNGFWIIITFFIFYLINNEYRKGQYKAQIINVFALIFNKFFNYVHYCLFYFVFKSIFGDRQDK